jgi:type III secretory pathway component EscR
LDVSQKARERYPTFQKKLTTIIELLKKARQGYRDFLKKFTKVTGLFKNYPAKSSNFFKNDLRGIFFFGGLNGLGS